MGKRKLMTINDLYNFCLKNNFYHFNSSDNDEEIYVQLPATFESEENFDKDKEGLTPFVAKAYHDHINLNKSEIKPETLESTLPSAMLRPILASIVTDEETGEKDFGSHDFSIEEDENGNEIIKYIEQPVGVIFGNNTIEYDEEEDVNRAILHGFLFNEYCQDAVDIMNRRKTVDCSVELSIREMSFNAADKVLTLDDFYVSGLTLLGSSVKPGMKGSQVTIEDFCEKDNSIFSNNEKLIEMLDQLNTKIDNLSNFTIQDNVHSKLEEGGNETVKFNELLEKYGKTVDDITFEYENLSDEELDAKFAEEFGEESSKDPASDEEKEDVEDSSANEEIDDNEESEEDSDEKDDLDNNITDTNACGGGSGSKKKKKKKHSRIYELSHDDVRCALYQLLAPYEESDNDYYWIVSVYDSYFVYQGCAGNYYGQKYSVKGESVAFDGERYELYVEFLTKSEKAALEEMKSNYAALEQFKVDTENAQLHTQREAILSDKKYSVLTEKDENNEYKNEAYAKLVSEMDNYSLTDLEKELKTVFADYITNGGQFAYAGEQEPKPTVSKKLFGNSTEKKTSRYGNLFNK